MVPLFKKKNQDLSGIKLQRFISCPHYIPMTDHPGPLSTRSKLMKQLQLEILPAKLTEGKENTRFSQLSPGGDTHQL